MRLILRHVSKHIHKSEIVWKNSTTLIPAEDTEKLKAHAEAFLDNVQLPYDVPKEESNACKFLRNTDCPLKKGQKVHYELAAPVDAPIIQTVDLQFELKDDNNRSVFCLKAKVTIVES